jgi:hypothetical protein
MGATQLLIILHASGFELQASRAEIEWALDKPGCDATLCGIFNEIEVSVYLILVGC